MSDLLIRRKARRERTIRCRACNDILIDGRTGIDVRVRRRPHRGEDGPNLPDAGRHADPRSRPATWFLSPPFVDCALPYGCDPQPTANRASTSQRHAARGHRALGRAEAAPDSRSDRRARPRLLRLGGRPRACWPSAAHVDVCDDRLARRAVRCSHVKKTGCATYLDLQLVAFPQDGLLRVAQRARQSEACAGHGRRRRGRDSSFRTHDGRGRGEREASSPSWPPSADCRSTCIVTKPTTRCHAISRRWRCTRIAWACT